MSAGRSSYGQDNDSSAYRYVMRKRRQGRKGHSFLGHILATALVILIVLLMLFLGVVVGAYVYYQRQLPLINSIAHHSLFQTTRIYDRHGKLLYELYDHQIGKGRRTYVNYKDISPLLINAT